MARFWKAAVAAMAGRLRRWGEARAARGRPRGQAQAREIVLCPGPDIDEAGFAWLDEATLSEAAALRARALAEASRAPWRPAPAGRRLARLAAQYPVLARGASEAERAALAAAMARHLLFLERRAGKAETALDDLVAASGRVLGALALGRDAEGAVESAAEALGAAAEAAIDAEGGVASRNPDALAQAQIRLAEAVSALEDCGATPPRPAREALERAGAALRALRHGDGRLPRLHGGKGDAATAEALDAALALHPPRRAAPMRGMGVERLAAGRAVALLDVDPPPPGGQASASALALEFSHGGAPLIGAVGPGDGLGGDWRRAARATAAFSALEIGGVSCCRLAPAGFASSVLGRGFVSGPSVVEAERAEDGQGRWAMAEHDGYLTRFGLIVARRLHLSPEGDALKGEDTLSAPTAEARGRFDKAARNGHVGFALRFHLHPQIDAKPLHSGAIRLETARGEHWTFRAAGGAATLEEGVWLDHDAGAARQTRMIAIIGAAIAYWGRVSWALERAHAARPG